MSPEVFAVRCLMGSSGLFVAARLRIGIQPTLLSLNAQGLELDLLARLCQDLGTNCYIDQRRKGGSRWEQKRILLDIRSYRSASCKMTWAQKGTESSDSIREVRHYRETQEDEGLHGCSWNGSCIWTNSAKHHPNSHPLRLDFVDLYKLQLLCKMYQSKVPANRESRGSSQLLTIRIQGTEVTQSSELSGDSLKESSWCARRFFDPFVLSILQGFREMSVLLWTSELHSLHVVSSESI